VKSAGEQTSQSVVNQTVTEGTWVGPSVGQLQHRINIHTSGGEVC